MTYIDFGPALRILSKLAPQLESIAIHGLEMPAMPLIEFGLSCKRLRRARLVSLNTSRGDWEASSHYHEEFGEWLKLASSLEHLDLTDSPLYQKEVRRGAPLRAPWPFGLTRGRALGPLTPAGAGSPHPSRRSHDGLGPLGP